MTSKEIQKKLLKVENDIVRGNKLFCSVHNIHWTKEHDMCLRNAMRGIFKEGIYPVIAELFGIKDKKYVPERSRNSHKKKDK